MARTPKLTIDYFPHQIGNGKKMFTIEKKYGNDGYATWFKILEILGETDNHYLDLSIKTNLMYVASKCNVSEELLIEIVDDLCNLEEIDSELWKIQVIWNQKFIDNIQTAYNKRTNPCITYIQVLTIFEEKGKLKKTPKQKPEKKTPVKKFDFKKALIDAGGTPETVHAWIAIRAKGRATNSEIAFNGIIREIGKSGLTTEQAILKAVERSWKGFDASWILNTSQTKSKTTSNNSGDNTDWDSEINEAHGK